RDFHVTGVQTCALPICLSHHPNRWRENSLTLRGQEKLPLCHIRHLRSVCKKESLDLESSYSICLWALWIITYPRWRGWRQSHILPRGPKLCALDKVLEHRHLLN